mmetsp:Transcript_7965/g.14760  ORF Transcript_7965/g.14760 Transcript_7965/m.14760 type:complete len:192 (-) Transcript_7965:121-696(-)|eukprot:CAMPEP_0197530350 /NCGR_PEP_ID=MMETSP1318-20131121/31527_1 /TAXON_ID=552666 /ORGANISM="Partenskyella glossopodia, Strain RCC365" /LENGTH=191 /DNA_ID=CAMNT_0043086135 /DNA_START=45 /DNA_END=620 /DNA_ORIENTATION=-
MRTQATSFAIVLAAATLAVVCIVSTRSARVANLQSPIRGAVRFQASSPTLKTGPIRQALQFPGRVSCMSSKKSGVSVCNNGIVVLKGARSRTSVNAENDFDAEAIVEDLKGKIDSIEDKPKAALIAAGGVAALTVGNAVVATIDTLPLVPGLMKLVGTTYSLWFAYRNLLFENNRQELTKDIEAIWKKISG